MYIFHMYILLLPSLETTQSNTEESGSEMIRGKLRVLRLVRINELNLSLPARSKNAPMDQTNENT